jgi:hypothetical protein
MNVHVNSCLFTNVHEIHEQDLTWDGQTNHYLIDMTSQAARSENSVTTWHSANQ